MIHLHSQMEVKRLNTTQLECFMEVANCLNFSRAAERLRITQPAVSHQINTLEAELGVKLFLRTSKNVRLTTEGSQFMHYAGEILKLTQLSKSRMKEAQKSLPRRLVIGCRNTLELQFVSPALRLLRARHPEVLPVLRLIPFDSMENLLAEGDVHIMFSFQDITLPKIRCRELLSCPAVCVCSQDHPLAGHETLTVAQLQNLQESGPMAVCRPQVCPPPLLHIQNSIANGRETSSIFFCDNLEIILPLLQSGYAFAVLADMPHTRRPDLCYIPLPEFPPLSLRAACQTGQSIPVLHDFLSILRESAAAPSP